MSNKLSDEERSLLQSQGVSDIDSRRITSDLHSKLKRLTEETLEGALTLNELQLVLRSTELSIKSMCMERKLLSIQVDDMELFPLFQFHNDLTIPEWKFVLNAIRPDVHPLALYRFMTLPSCDLVLEGENVSPRNWLISGQPADELLLMLTDL